MGRTIANWLGYDHDNYCKAIHINCLTMRHPDGPQNNGEKKWQEKFDKDQVIQVLENNGCKIMTKWKRRVITKGQKDSRDLKSKCFTKKMIVVGFEDNGTMEFIADAHYMGNELSKQFLDNYDKNRARLRIESFQRYSPTLIYNIGSKNAICLNKECLEVVWRDSLRKELAFLYLNPNLYCFLHLLAHSRSSLFVLFLHSGRHCDHSLHLIASAFHFGRIMPSYQCHSNRAQKQLSMTICAEDLGAPILLGRRSRPEG